MDRGVNAKDRKAAPYEGDPSAIPPDTGPVTSPLGLFLFGFTALLLSLYIAGLSPAQNVATGLGIFCCGSLQILLGVIAWRKKESFAAIVFAPYGLFWLSMIALVVLPAADRGGTPQPSVMAAYLTMWGLFSAMLFGSMFRLDRALQFAFGLMTLFFFLYAVGVGSGSAALRAVAGYEGIVCALSIITVGMIRAGRRVRGRLAAV